MGDLPAFPEIDHCLLIYDDRHEDEGAADVELVLFFWPNHVDIGNQLALQGACSFVKGFSQSFTGSPVRVFEMKRFKLAMRTIGNVNLVLTAGLSYSRKSLETQLDHVVQAFHFFHLSHDNIEQRARYRIGPELAAEETERGVISPLRQAIINEYQLAGTLLIPMVQAFHNSLTKNFHPLQYSRLLGLYPAVGNIITSRLLAKASTLVWSCAAIEEFISGCVLDREGNILVTHVDVETTRWICNSLCVDPARMTTDLVVYLKQSKVNFLLEQKREFFRPKHEFIDRASELSSSGFLSPPAFGSASAPHLHNTSGLSLSASSDYLPQKSGEFFPRPNSEASTSPGDDLIPMRLLFVHRQRLTLCIFTHINVQPFNAFHRIDALAGEIAALELAIARVDPPAAVDSSTTSVLAVSTGNTPYGSQSALEPTSSLGTQSLSAALAQATITHSAPTSALSSPVRAPSQPHSVPGTPPPLSGPMASQSNILVASPVLAVSARTISRGLPASPRSEPGGNAVIPPSLRTSSSAQSGRDGSPFFSGAQSSPHATSSSQSTKTPANSYNYLAFSEETHTQEGNIGVRRPDAEITFFENLSFVHDTFNETPQITKVVYRDQQGTMFCRKIFGKETYFQQLSSGQTSKFAHFEDKARELLGQEHSVFLV